VTGEPLVLLSYEVKGLAIGYSDKIQLQWNTNGKPWDCVWPVE